MELRGVEPLSTQPRVRQSALLAACFVQTFSDDLISKMAQPVSEEGYAVSVVEPAEAGMPALGLSFPRARLGMLFLPLQFDGAEVIHDVSPNEYARVVLERYGVAIKDPSLRHGEERSSGGEARP